MPSFDRLSFYERLHHHELEIKERISTRAQISFAAIFATATVSVYILRVLDYSSDPIAFGFIIPLMAGHILGMLIATKYALEAFWGNWFASMPLANEIFDYEQSLQKYNEETTIYNRAYPASAQALVNVETTTQAFLIQRYRICATHNAKVNKKRSDHIHTCIRFVVYSALPLFISAALFVSFDMDASSPRKSIKINDDAISNEIVKLNAQIKEIIQMKQKETEEKKVSNPSPPKMPTPPTVRVALEDFKIEDGEMLNERKTTK